MVDAHKCSLLVVDDEPYILPTLTDLLARDYEVLAADSAEAAKDLLHRHSIDLILTDQRMPRCTGVQLLEWVREHYPRTVRLLMTGCGELEDAVDAINRGHVYYFVLKPWRTEELRQVLRNAAEKFILERNQEQLLDELRALNRDLEARVAERTRELEVANRLLQQRTHELEEANHLLQQRTRELERLALTDPLTCLANRRAIEELANFELKRHARYPNSLTIGLIDADLFREINNKYLYTGGDEVLRGLACILTQSIREVDSVGRIGGEEFLVIARETDEEGARHLAERIRATVANTPIRFHEHQISITVSLGFAVAPAGIPANYLQMHELAAHALKTAKANGRNGFIVSSLRIPAGDPVTR
jgi:diguanylate cyclase (GGDEF)-like protein